MKAALCLLILFVSAAAATAQKYEYGKPAELRGLKTYMVDTFGMVKVRTEIVDRISKAIPGLRLVDEAGAAEIDLSYEPISSDEHAAGFGVVAIDAKGTDKTRPRIILNFEPGGNTIFGKRTHIKFADEFIRAYKKANGLM